jgi:hypothetical protein
LRQIAIIGVEKMECGPGEARRVMMCDYSLQSVASRPAKVGDRLVSTRFENSVTRGFAAVDQPDVAICLLPGTEVAFESAVEYDAFIPFLKRRQPQRVARFREINTNYTATHHDALEFPDGKIVLLNVLREGQRLTVLQLPVLARLEAEIEATTPKLVPESTTAVEAAIP